MRRIIVAVSLFLISEFAWAGAATDHTPVDAAESARLAAEVRAEFLHA